MKSSKIKSPFKLSGKRLLGVFLVLLYQESSSPSELVLYLLGSTYKFGISSLLASPRLRR